MLLYAVEQRAIDRRSRLSEARFDCQAIVAVTTRSLLYQQWESVGEHARDGTPNRRTTRNFAE
jgi:hypothetical protein